MNSLTKGILAFSISCLAIVGMCLFKKVLNPYHFALIPLAGLAWAFLIAKCPEEKLIYGSIFPAMISFTCVNYSMMLTGTTGDLFYILAFLILGNMYYELVFKKDHNPK